MKKNIFLLSIAAIFGISMILTSCNPDEPNNPVNPNIPNNHGIYKPTKKIGNINFHINTPAPGMRDDDPSPFQKWTWDGDLLMKIEDLSGYMAYEYKYDSNNVLKEIFINVDDNIDDDDDMVAKYYYSNNGIIEKILIYEMKDNNYNNLDLEYKFIFTNNGNKITEILFIDVENHRAKMSSREFNEIYKPIFSMLLPQQVAPAANKSIQRSIDNNMRAEIELRMKLYYDANDENLTQILVYEDNHAEPEETIKFLEYDDCINPYYSFLSPIGDDDLAGGDDLIQLNPIYISKNNPIKIETTEVDDDNDVEIEYIIKEYEYNGKFPTKIVTKSYELDANGNPTDIEIESTFWYEYL